MAPGSVISAQQSMYLLELFLILQNERIFPFLDVVFYFYASGPDLHEYSCSVF